MNNIIIYFSILFFCISCITTNQESVLTGSRYVIDLDENREASMPYSSVFKKDVRTVVLETDSNCLIGLISEMQVFDGYIYIFDRQTQALFVFDTEGRFIRKIGNRGAGPGEYIQLSDFTIDTENGFIFLLDNRSGNSVHKYGLDGIYINTIALKLPSNSSSISIQYYKGSLYADIYSWKHNMENNMLLKIDMNNGQILSQSLPVAYNKGWAEPQSTGHRFFMSRINSPLKYTQLFMNNIVSIEDTLTSYIELKSKNLVTESDLDKLPESMFLMEKLKPFEGSSKIWDLQGFMESSDFIIFKYQMGIFNFHTTLFNKKNKTVTNVKKFDNDIIFKQGGSGNRFGQFVFADTQGTYEIMYQKALQEHVSKDEFIPQLDKLEQLTRLNTDSNPVIFYYEFK